LDSASSVLEARSKLTAHFFASTRLSPALGTDAGVRRSANNFSKPIVWIEDPCDVLRTLVEASLLHDELSLVAYATSIADKRLASALSRLENAWRNGDHDDACASVEALSIFGKSDERVFERVVTRRNLQMAENIGKQPQNEPIVVAVGLAHFCGERSFVEELRKSGYVVQKTSPTIR
jgi:uncharacterized protein YbaP (TraB family)